MKPHFPASTIALGVALASGVLLVQPLGAQYGSELKVPQGSAWDTSRFRIRPLSVEPGGTLPASGNQVLVHLTADASGRMPAEAVWQSAGSAAAQNRGAARLDAIAIELKDLPRHETGGSPLEAIDVQTGLRVTPLIDNEQVVVTKHRYEPHVYGGPLHVHASDVVVVYLRGGYTWPWEDIIGAVRVRRGDVDVIPANTLHRLGNAGGDPLELLVVVPK